MADDPQDRLRRRGPRHNWPRSSKTAGNIAEAADYWRRRYQGISAPGNNNYRQQRLDQIVGNWGRFEPGDDPARRPGSHGRISASATASRSQFEAHAIQRRQAAGRREDTTSKANPTPVDWQKINIGDIGYRLVTENQQQYVGDKVAAWELDLEPRRAAFRQARHGRRRRLQKAGAYLLEAKMAGGNVSYIVVWLADTAIVKKPLVGKTYYFVGDAVSGQPVPKANVEFFGYQNKFLGGNQHGRSTRWISPNSPTPRARSCPNTS